MSASDETDDKRPVAADLKELEAKIAAAKTQVEPPPRVKKDYAQAQLAWRMVIELVSGLLLGFGIGYGIDVLAGTTPLFMIIFIGLGFVAGVKTVIRSAREVQEMQAPSGDLPQ